MGGVPVAFNGSSIGFLTPPAVGPGVVAYGAVSVPYLSPYNPYLPGSPGMTGFNVGGGLMSSRGPIPRMVTVSYQNVEVRDALALLTTVDFGYEIDEWRQWMSRNFDPNPEPVRRVPQP